ncbi:hypothetical protein [Demequina soli]|uniref:hypothetical protein n=1 Tax=Demequina soli TaxID=1638987 RepID=UPI0007825907|nr:hypothetical protein [Demequina soli]
MSQSPQSPQQPEPSEPPRSWLPIAIAGGIALLVIVIAFVSAASRSGMSAAHQSAITVCEDAYAATGADTGQQPRIEAGDVYSASDWRDLRDLVEQQGLIDGATSKVPADTADALDAAAASLTKGGTDHVTVVWWLESEKHLVCTVDVNGDVADASTVRLGPLTADTWKGADQG